MSSACAVVGAAMAGAGVARTVSAEQILRGANLLGPGTAVAPAERLSHGGVLHFPVDVTGGDLVMPNGFGGYSGVRGTGGHHGVDIGNGCTPGRGRALLACVDGFLEGDEYGSGGGNMRILRDGIGNYFRYHHLDAYETSLTPGDQVRRGQVIGYMGTSGNTSWAHLHFEVWVGGISPNQGGTVVDPEPWLGLPMAGVTSGAPTC